jgi:hypothetical protein
LATSGDIDDAKQHYEQLADYPASSAGHKRRMMVEVFKTNVERAEEARKLLEVLQQHFPGCHINFDLHDCDKILRVKHNGVNTSEIAQLVHQSGFICEELQD